MIKNIRPLFLRTTVMVGAALVVALHAPVQAQGLRLSGGGSGSSYSLGGASGAQGLQGVASNAAASAQGASGSRQADFIVALVNAEPITNNELDRRMERAREYYSQQQRMPSDDVLRQEVLDVLIGERLQLQEAKDMKIVVDDYTLDSAERNVAEQNNVSLSQMYHELSSLGINKERFRSQLRNQLTLMRVRERAVESRVRVSDQELDRYLRENPIDMGQDVPAALNLGHVLVVVPENATPVQEAEYKKRIEEAAAKLVGGTSFEEVAREYSDASEGRNGGALGLRPVSQYPELFLQATENQAVGSIVGPIRSGAGFHLLKVLDRQDGGAGMVVQNHARHILITPASGRSEREIAQLLSEIRERVVNDGEDFAVLARQYSEDPGSGPNGGDLGWVGPGMFVPEFESVLNELMPGDVSQPTVSRFGLHLIQLIDRRQHKMTQREQREMVRNQVREEKTEKEFEKWVGELRARAFVEIRDADQLY